LRELASLWGDTAVPERGGCDSCSAGRHEDAHAAAAADWGVHAVASPRLHRHSAFLGTAGGSSSSSAGVAPENNAGFGVVLSTAPRCRTSFKVDFVGVKLGPVRTQLVYQSPEVYTTTVSQVDEKCMGKCFDAKFENEMASMPFPHPSIEFNARHHTVYVHMVDKTTGEVLWDATYKTAMPFFREVKSTSIPTGGTHPLFKKFWIPPEDPGPHLFDITISTRDHWFPDVPDTEYGDREGFDNLYGHSAHIGISAFRLPKLIPSEDVFTDPKQNPYPSQMIEDPCVGAECGNTDIHNDTTERLLNGEEDPFLVKPGDMGTPGDDNRLYYGWMVEKDGITKDDYGYLFTSKEPPLVRPNWVDYNAPPKNKNKPPPQPGDNAAGPVDESGQL